MRCSQSRRQRNQGAKPLIGGPETVQTNRATSSDLAVELAQDWLQRCADLACRPEAELIDRVLRSPSRSELRTIGEARRARALDDERRRNWDAVQVLVDFKGAAARLGKTAEPELLWHLRAREQSREGAERTHLRLSAEQLTWTISAFREVWPYTGYPSESSWGDHHPWDATDYLNGLIARLGEDISEEATRALEALKDAAPDGYTERIKAVLAEHRRKKVEQSYTPPTVSDIRVIIEATSPTTSNDLQATVLDILEVAQSRLKGDPVDWYRGFFNEAGAHKDEEACRDELVKLLQAIDNNFEYIPEAHSADDKRVDIVVGRGLQLILPIEIKGTWHPKLWTAADEQLDHLYVTDWRAERGIYLVLWFGPGTRITQPPRGHTAPLTPDQLKAALETTSKAAGAGNVDIVVLDLTRPSA